MPRGRLVVRDSSAAMPGVESSNRRRRPPKALSLWLSLRSADGLILRSSLFTRVGHSVQNQVVGIVCLNPERIPRLVCESKKEYLPHAAHGHRASFVPMDEAPFYPHFRLWVKCSQIPSILVYHTSCDVMICGRARGRRVSEDRLPSNPFPN